MKFFFLLSFRFVFLEGSVISISKSKIFMMIYSYPTFMFDIILWKFSCPWNTTDLWNRTCACPWKKKKITHFVWPWDRPSQPLSRELWVPRSISFLEEKWEKYSGRFIGWSIEKCQIYREKPIEIRPFVFVDWTIQKIEEIWIQNRYLWNCLPEMVTGNRLHFRRRK